ncbi:MAG TPA: 6-carboxytetrahydropterin synthase QueD [Thermodesulfobacteriaceae bacterium]|nr:6-carboxytetrahydropterin synthase QueD [Thermodesulfobacteriaceae bacterium]
MFDVFIKTHFSAAHFLRNYPGDCENLHGHNWDVEVVVRTEALNEIDVGIDFRDLKKIVYSIMDELDHTNLNEHPGFQEINPSSERLAQYIFDRLDSQLDRYSGVEPAQVTVCETPKTGVTYWKNV